MPRHFFLIVALIVLVATVVLWPHPAQANLASEVASAGLTSILDLVRTALVFVQQLLTSLISKMGDLLQSVLSLQLTYGGPTVYVVWKMIRDTCNMLFIVLFVTMAFGTIFNVVWKNKFHYSSALMGIILAAISINFSLAIGQTIVWAGNAASTLVINLMNGENVGAQVATSLSLANVIATQTTSNQVVPPVTSNLPSVDQLTPEQKIYLQTWYNWNGSSNNITSLNGHTTLTVLSNCLKFSKKTVDECFKQAETTARNYLASGTAQQATADTATTNAQRGSVTTIVGDAWHLVSNLATGNVSEATTVIPAASVNAGSTSVTGQIGLIINVLLSDFMLLVLALSFLAVIIFMVVRIPAIWFLLAVSAGAFFTIALPNAGTFKKWFNNLLGWCIFSPLYLLIIYLGLYFIGQQGSLMASLNNAQMPFFAGTLGSILGFFIAGTMFLGGAKWAMDTAFKLSSGASATFGKIGGFLGVSEKTKFGISTIAQKTGITPNAQALAERAKQQFGDVTAGIRGRFPIIKSQEDALAAARKRAGVRGGAAEFAKIERGRVESEQKIIKEHQEAQLRKLQNARAQARTNEERTKIDGQIKKLKEVQTIDLKKQLNSGNRDVRLAAGELLMNDGKLTATELQNLGDQYRGISREALAGFVDRRDTQLIKDAGKRKYTKGEEAKEMASFIALMADPKKAGKYVEAARKGNNKFWALEAGTSRKVIMGADGKTPMTMEQAVRQEADQFNATDLVHAEDYYNKNKTEMPKELKLQYSRSLLTPKRLSQMITSSRSDKAQVKRIIADRRRTDTEIELLNNNIRDLTDDIKKARDEEIAAKKAGSADNERVAREKIRNLQTNVDGARKRLSELKRPIKEEKKSKEEEEKEKKEKEKEESGSGGEKEPKK